MDSQWQEAGNRREAFYTNLKPGKYRFHVLAANEDGVWNETGTSLAFSIAPAYYQTWWFRVLCVAAGFVLLAIYLVLRLRRYATELRLRLEERHFERDRIARDLHDTLLQSVHGLMIQFESAASQIPVGSPTRGRINEALDSAEKVIVEGRDRVSELRAVGEGLGDLPSAVRRVGESFAAIHDFRFHLRRMGTPRELQPLVADECFSIAREAITNAAQHSHAKSLRVTISYGRTQLVISIKDDGVGMTPGQEATVKRDHFGMVGMRERAAHIGATLDVTSALGEGVAITLRASAKRAYRRRRSRPMHPKT